MMLSSVGLRVLNANDRTLAFQLASGRGRIACVLFVAVFCAVSVGGCAQRLAADGGPIASGGAHATSEATPKVRTASRPASPRPHRTLLQPQPAPDCTFRGPVSSPMTAEETRMKLDYEQQCYRQAEANARARLQQLQDSVSATKKASR